jgi:hypothetical protein
MIHEISQLDIPDRQLLNNVRPNVWTEIGEATITHTIFGRAKVRIVRKNDNVRRVLWLIAFVAVAIALAVWQGWFAPQESDQQPSADSLSSESVKEQVSAPALQNDNNAVPAAPLAVTTEPATQSPTEIDKPVIVHKREPQPTQGLTGAEHRAAKPVTSLPQPGMDQQKPMTAQTKPVVAQPPSTSKQLTANNAQAAPLAAGSNVSRNPTDTLATTKLPAPKPVAAPSIATSPVAKSVIHPAASGAAAAPLLSAPLGKEDTSTPSPATVDQPAASANVQSK